MQLTVQLPTPACSAARKVKILSHYNFYLAFENLQVDDYVSEKVFEALFAGAVPGTCTPLFPNPNAITTTTTMMMMMITNVRCSD